MKTLTIVLLVSLFVFAGYSADVDVPEGRIAFVSALDGIFEIFVVDANGNNETRLSYGGDHKLYPTWSPGGSHIAFESIRSGNFEIIVMDANGSNQVQLTTEGGKDLDWSPDGKYIVFGSDRDGDAKILVMDADGRNQTQLTTWISVLPAWCPVVE